MSRTQLATYVHVADEHGKMHVFGPGDEVPDWATAKIVNPKAWRAGEAPGAATEAVKADEVARLRQQLADAEARAAAAEARLTGDAPTGTPPPRAGAGSGRDVWARYAADNNVEIPDGATREQIITALDDADIPTE